jgi:hypothetical protein
MPLTKKGKRVRKDFLEQYGKRRGNSIFYAYENKNPFIGLKSKGRSR